MRSLARRVWQVPHSGIRQLFRQAEHLEGVVHLGLGDPAFPTPGHIVEAACAGARAGWTHYTANAGAPALREAIAAWAEARLHRPVDPTSEVVVTAGAMEALYLAFQVLVDEGDEVLLPTPGYPNYEAQVRMAGGIPRWVPLDPARGFVPTAADYARVATEKTVAMVLCSPSNPTGAVIPPEEAGALAALAARRDWHVIADDVYGELQYEGPPVRVAGDPLLKDRVVWVGSVSKAYAMTGWRIGWAVAPAAWVEAMVKLQEHVVACAPSPSQAAAVQALRAGEGDVQALRERCRTLRDRVVEHLGLIPDLRLVPPAGGIYAWVGLPPRVPSWRFAEVLLLRYRVAVTPGAAFGPGGEGYIRLCFAVPEERLDEGLRRLDRAVKDPEFWKEVVSGTGEAQGSDA